MKYNPLWATPAPVLADDVAAPRTHFFLPLDFQPQAFVSNEQMPLLSCWASVTETVGSACAGAAGVSSSGSRRSALACS